MAHLLGQHDPAGALALKAFSLAGRLRELQNSMKWLKVPSKEAQLFGK